MNYLLDTNVVSELRKRGDRVEATVKAWVAAQPPMNLYLSVITVLELELGAARLRRKDELQARRIDGWIRDAVLPAFDKRILPIDVPVARRAAVLHIPDPRPERDALIAATASVNDLTLVTRNVRDFESAGIPVFNPWP